ncbi:MAG: phage portal protein [Alphaproteobacteria bacterium]|nr:phage portal protein [Alphaproteobacteria bacterium]
MTLWNRVFGSDVTAPSSRDPSDSFWYRPVSSPVAAGVDVTIERARRIPVVRDCLQVLSHSVAGLSWGIFERISSGETKVRRDHPLTAVFNDPNPEMTPFEFFASLVDDLATEGNFFAEIKPGTRGQIHYLWRIEPKHVTVERLPNRDRRFRIREPGMPERVLLTGEIWHVRVPPLISNLIGTSTIMEGRDAIGAAIAVQDYAAAFFKNDATPPFVLKYASKFKDEESKLNFLNSFTRWVTGNNRHKPGILEHDIGIERLGVTQEESQFLETRREIALDCSRLWRIPPHKVGILDRATFSNIEQQSLEFVVDTLTPWLELIENSANKELILFPNKYYFEFNVASLLRGDLKSRYEAYAQGRQWGWLSVNEIRRLENMNGIGVTGNRYIEPLNMAPAGMPRNSNQKNKQAAISFLRETVASNGGRPNLEVVRNVA